MTTVRYDRDLDAPVSAIWHVLSNFGGFLDWAGGGQTGGTIKVTGDGPGMVRAMNIPGIGEISERLDALDADSLSMGYTLVAGQPLGMAAYQCKVNLSDPGDGGCHIYWHGEFEGVAGADEAEVGEALKGSYIGMSDALMAFIKS